MITNFELDINRKKIVMDSERLILSPLFETLGFKNDNIAFDPFRLGDITPSGDLNPAAAPIYFPHRDTWSITYGALDTGSPRGYSLQSRSP